MKTFYHGTVKAYLPEILKEGLKPDADHAWRVTREPHDDDPSVFDGENLRKVEPVAYVYLSPSLDFAEEMAVAKAEYLQLKPGESSSVFYVTKASDAPILKTTPVVLKVLLPETAQVEIDPRAMSHGGVRYQGTIQPKYLKQERI